MSFSDRLRPENNQLDMCIGCPCREDSLASACMARIVLGSRYRACESGPWKAGETIHVQDIVSENISIGFAGTTAGIFTVTTSQIECGKAVFPTDMATSTLLLNGLVHEVTNLETGIRIWGGDNINDSLDYE